jgi:urea transport system substrate-binding protein
MRTRRSSTLAAGALLGLATLTAGCGSTSNSAAGSGGESPGVSGSDVKVGILHSLTGTMSISEPAVACAEKLAIEEINKKGGVLGKQIKVQEEDGASDWPTFAAKIEKLIKVDKVAVTFGGWTSASRKNMLPKVEENQGLLFYPVQYEGLEASPNIFYTGATTNQQIVPGLEYLKEQGLTKVFLVGSDYVFPKTANKEIKAWAAANGMEIVGEEYLPLGNNEVSPIITKIYEQNPQAVFNTLNGDSNVAFFKELKARGNTPDKIQTISVSIAEEEVGGVGADNLAGHLTAWNYYETTDTPKNKEFVAAYKAFASTCLKKDASKVHTDDPIEAGYNAVYIWAAAAEKAKSFEVEKVREAAKGLKLETPEGPLTVSDWNQHVFKTARIGKVRADGLIDEVWSSKTPLEPDPCLDNATWAKSLATDACDEAKTSAGKK